MPVFAYTSVVKEREYMTESGTVVAKSEAEAKQKLKALALGNAKVRRLKGLRALIGQFRADIR